MKWIRGFLLLLFLIELPPYFLPYSEMTVFDRYISDWAEYILVTIIFAGACFGIPWDNYETKLGSFFGFCIAAFNCLAYLEYITTNLDFKFLTSAMVVLIGFLVVGYVVNIKRLRYYQEVDTPYTAEGTFIARKKPMSGRAFAISLFYQDPMNTISIIDNGVWNKMNRTYKGKVIGEKELGKLGNYYLERISLSEAQRQALFNARGKRFNLVFVNCWTVTRGILSA